MPTAEDTEITLGTGKMLVLFFGLVALCAVFFATGFSLGRNSALRATASDTIFPPPRDTSLRSAAVKAPSSGSASAPDQVSKSADPTDESPTVSTPVPPPASGAVAPDPLTVPVTNGYYVQVAAVSKQEDADALVDALKKKQYPAFSANAASDKLLHVELGPYGDLKEAEGMRAKLISDGYNPILKK
jgi:cell division septation protein DedD